MFWIDAHQHLWNRSRSEYTWLTPDAGPLYRDFSMDDFHEERTASAIGATILVQASDTWEDTLLMVEAADADPTIVGIVGWVPLDDAVRAAILLNSQAGRRLCGIRNLTHVKGDDNWLLRSDVAEGLSLVVERGLCLDAVPVNANQTRAYLEIGRRHPDLSMVIDHVGKPLLDWDRSEWVDVMQMAAENQSVYVKLSGLYPSSAPAAWTREDVASIVTETLGIFGPERVMVGSDWPMSLLAGGHRGVWQALTDALPHANRSAVAWRNAAQFYGVASRAEGLGARD